MAGEAPAPRAPGLTLRTRLTAILGLVALLLVGTLGAQLVLQSRQRDIRNDLLERIDPALVALGDLRAGLVDQESGVRGYALAGDPRFLEPYERGQGAAADAAARLAELLGDSPLADEVRTVDELTETWRVEIAEPSIAATQQGTGIAATDEFQIEGRQRFDAIRAAIDDVDRALTRERAMQVDDLDAAARDATVTMFLQALGLVLSGALIVVALNRVVVGPIRRLGRDARRVAEGDLGHPVRGEGSPDLVALGEDVDAMRRRILDEVDQLNAASADLARQADDLARSNADLEQFAYVASHDLQEPLRMVASYVQLLSRRYKGKLDKDADEFIAFAVDGATRMQNLIRDLLTYSRVTRLARPMEVVDTGQALLAALVNLKVAVEEARAHVAYDSLPPVRGDATALIALFQNLVGNAVKFRGGRTPEIRIEAARRGDEWIFSVKDNGIGFDPQYRERVFVIFQRLNTRDKYEGTGIGLAICKKIVERHGGRIWVETKPGEGSTFFFSLPGLPSDARRTAHASGRSESPGP